jgi:dienelactone hydrolase
MNHHHARVSCHADQIRRTRSHRRTCAAIPAGLAASVADFLELATPAGKGPFPAVVLAPGCGGFHEGYSQPVFDKYRSRLVDDGFAVINVDFTRAHDIPSCADDNGSLISSEDYAKDILAAVTYLAKESAIDPTRIHVMGWSFSGGASFSALALAERESVKINSVVAFYPYCEGALGWKQPTPVLTLVALADNVAPFAQCKGWVKEALDNKSMRAPPAAEVPNGAPTHAKAGTEWYGKL